MAQMIRTYPTAEAARQAVEELRAAVPAREIWLLTSQPLPHDGRGPRGTFAGPVGLDAQVGAFTGPPRRLDQAQGSFATGGVKGDPSSHRKGSFADVERVAIVTYQEDTERGRVTGYRGLRILLRRSALEESVLDMTIKVLHSGHSVVLVDASGVASNETLDRLQRAAKAA